jgi:phage shock protein C
VSGYTRQEAQADLGSRMSPLIEQVLLAIYHGQQEHAWSQVFVEHVEGALEAAGLHRRLDRPPAMCFLFREPRAAVLAALEMTEREAIACTEALVAPACQQPRTVCDNAVARRSELVRGRMWPPATGHSLTNTGQPGLQAPIAKGGAMAETRKLYRSQTNRQVAGVCGGLAEYFNLDATLIRILFVVLAVLGGSGIVLYLAMWIIVPKEPSGGA